MEGKGFFTKELEEALLNGSIDLAVHSHKDLPTQNPAGLMVATVSEREDPAELLLIRTDADGKGLDALPKGAHVGTSSARRKAQLLHLRPDLRITDLRGNVPTRVQKLRDGQYDAIMLAAAGIGRLGLNLSGLSVQRLDPGYFIPAPAQGVLALQTRETDTALIAAIAPLNDADVQRRIGVERGILAGFGGGCQIPLGAYCEERENTLHVRACVAQAWDTPLHTVTLSGSDAKELVSQAVAALKSGS
jgi:hydroxymethylbilane synthase